MPNSSAETQGPNLSIKLTESKAEDTALRSDSPDMDGRFEIIKRIGAGGMNCVYRSRDNKTGKLVALRAFEKPKKGDHDEADHAMRMERMRREAKLLASVRHENLLEYYGAFEDSEGDGYIVIELIENGGELSHIIEKAVESHQGVKPRGSVVPEEVLEAVVRQLLSVVGAIHSHKLIHRDIKPENIMFSRIDSAIRIKLIDFGLGKNLDDKSPEDSLTKEGDVMGSLEYMAPEQLVSTKRADHRADLYAVGAVLYELVTGKRRIDMKGVANPQEAVGRVIVAHAKPLDPSLYPREFVKQMNPLLEQLILDLLERDPSKRPQTAAEALTRFEEAMAHHEPSKPSLPRIADSISTSKPLNSPSESVHIPMSGGGNARWVIGGIVVIAIACIGAFVTFKWLSQEPVKSTSPASTTTERSPFASSSARAQVSAPPVHSQAPVASVTATATAPPPTIQTYASLTAAQRSKIDAVKADLARGGRCTGMTRDLIGLTREAADFPDTYYYLAECATRAGTDDSSFRKQYSERSGGRTSP